MNSLVEGDIEEGRNIVERSKNDFTFTRLRKIIFCFLGLQISYVVWGVMQETLMTQQYHMGKFKSSAFCVFGNRFLALLISLVIVSFNQYTTSTIPSAPFYSYLPASLSNTISSWAQYEALKYVSFPTQVLSKSCKMIPVMLVGVLINRTTYTRYEMVEAVLITVGVSLFSFSEKVNTSTQSDSLLGFSLLVCYLACDSFTSQWQSKVFKQYGIDHYQMMLGVNIWSMILTGITLYQAGDFFPSLVFLLSDSTAFLHMIVLSLTSATGQLFIFYTVKELGPLALTMILTTRQAISLLVSCVLFDHTIHWFGCLGSVLVFAVVLYGLCFKRAQ